MPLIPKDFVSSGDYGDLETLTKDLAHWFEECNKENAKRREYQNKQKEQDARNAEQAR